MVVKMSMDKMEVMEMIKSHSKDCKDSERVDKEFFFKEKNKTFVWVIGMFAVVLLSVWGWTLKISSDVAAVQANTQLLIDLEKSRTTKEGTLYEFSDFSLEK